MCTIAISCSWNDARPKRAYILGIGRDQWSNEQYCHWSVEAASAVSGANGSVVSSQMTAVRDEEAIGARQVTDGSIGGDRTEIELIIDPP